MFLTSITEVSSSYELYLIHLLYQERRKERKKELKEKKNNFHALRYVHTYGRESSELIELMMFNTLPHTDNVINVPFLCEDYPVLG